MTLSFFTVLTIISVFLTLILSLFFLITKKGYSNANKLLAAILVIFCIQIFFSFATSSYALQYFMNSHKILFLLKQTSFLFGPLILFYIHSFLRKSFIFSWSTLFHLLPFLGSLVFLAFFYTNTNHFIIWLSFINLYDTILILIHNMVYILLSVLAMRSMNVDFLGFYRSIKSSSYITWLQMILLGFIVLWVVNLNSFAIVMIVRSPGWCAYTASINALVAFLFVNTIMLFLLFKPDIYYMIEKYKTNKLEEQDKEEYIHRLNTYMNSKAYLDPDISIEMLASAISVKPRILSQIINETFNKTFKGYILEFRIKESMQLLSDPKFNNLTVQEILYKVGFNSKSTFNKQFKLYTNVTPQEYRSKFTC